jgi:predicted nucleic-acid-binding protein
VKIIADTNLLVRAITDDDPVQSKIARDVLERAEAVVLTLPALCEFVWVLRLSFRRPMQEIAEAVRLLTESETVIVQKAAVAAGLAMMVAGGDFADGVIAHEGAQLGGEVFASFDRRAVKLLGERARLLG